MARTYTPLKPACGGTLGVGNPSRTFLFMDPGTLGVEGRGPGLNAHTGQLALVAERYTRFMTFPKP